MVMFDNSVVINCYFGEKTIRSSEVRKKSGTWHITYKMYNLSMPDCIVNHSTHYEIEL